MFVIKRFKKQKYVLILLFAFFVTMPIILQAAPLTLSYENYLFKNDYLSSIAWDCTIIKDQGNNRIKLYGLYGGNSTETPCIAVLDYDGNMISNKGASIRHALYNGWVYSSEEANADVIAYGNNGQYEQSAVLAVYDSDLNLVFEDDFGERHCYIWSVYQAENGVIYGIYLDDNGNHSLYKWTRSGTRTYLGGIERPSGAPTSTKAMKIIGMDSSGNLLIMHIGFQSGLATQYLLKTNQQGKLVSSTIIGKSYAIECKMVGNKIVSCINNTIYIYDMNLNLINQFAVYNPYVGTEYLNISMLDEEMFVVTGEKSSSYSEGNFMLNIYDINGKLYHTWGKLISEATESMNISEKIVKVVLLSNGNYAAVIPTGKAPNHAGYTKVMKFTVPPPQIGIGTDYLRIGDNTPASLKVSLVDNGNVISSIKVTDTVNTTYYNSNYNDLIVITLGEGDTVLKAQVVGKNGSILATSNLLTINKRNLLAHIISTGSAQSNVTRIVILNDTDRYYENNSANQQLVTQIKGRIDGIFIINNDVSPVLVPLLG